MKKIQIENRIKPGKKFQWDQMQDSKDKEIKQCEIDEKYGLKYEKKNQYQK